MAEAYPYGMSYYSLGAGRFNFEQDTLKVMLTSVNYVPNVDTHEFASSVTNEISGTGYTLGGKTLIGVDWSFSADENLAVLSCDPVFWSGATFTARYGVIYKYTGDLTDSPLLSYVNLLTNTSVVSSTFRLTFANGIYRLRTPE